MIEARTAVETQNTRWDCHRGFSKSFAGVANPIIQNYKYDSLYRLTEAEETAGAAQNWVQQFQYDRFGNRIAFSQTLNKTSGATQTSTKPAIDPPTSL